MPLRLHPCPCQQIHQPVYHPSAPLHSSALLLLNGVAVVSSCAQRHIHVGEHADTHSLTHSQSSCGISIGCGVITAPAPAESIAAVVKAFGALSKIAGSTIAGSGTVFVGKSCHGQQLSPRDLWGSYHVLHRAHCRRGGGREELRRRGLHRRELSLASFQERSQLKVRDFQLFVPTLILQRTEVSESLHA